MYKLIIIDDDSLMLRHFVSGYDWASMGFDVCASFTTAEEGLEYLKNNTVHAVLTDIKMPNMSGLDLASVCHSLYPDMPFILLSAFSNFEYARQAIKYNVIDYVLKPIGDEDLKGALSKLSAYLDKTHFSKAVEQNTMSISDIDRNASMNMTQIKKYIADNLNGSLSVNDVANHAMINPKYFSFYFKKHTGMDFSNYIKNARLEKACELLVNSDFKVSTIANMVGYKVTSPFFKYFSDKYAMTPIEYRNKFKTKK